MKRLIKKLKAREGGFTLIEVLISLAILGIIGVGLLSAMGGAFKATLVSDERTIAESIARTQLEYIKNQPFALSYADQTPDVHKDAGFAVTIAATNVKAGLQKVTVTIARNGEYILTLQGYKANR